MVGIVSNVQLIKILSPLVRSIPIAQSVKRYPQEIGGRGFESHHSRVFSLSLSNLNKFEKVGVLDSCDLTSLGIINAFNDSYYYTHRL